MQNFWLKIVERSETIFSCEALHKVGRAKRGAGHLFKRKACKRPLQVFWLRLQNLGKLLYYSLYLLAHQLFIVKQ